MATLLILTQLCMACLDISAHSLMLKELKSKSHTSIIMGYASIAGNAIVTLFLLKLTSLSFAKSIGLSQPITTPFVFLIIFGVMAIALGVFFHFYFK